MNSRELWEAFSEVEDRYLELLDTPEQENYEMKRTYTRKTVMALIAAIISISLLAMTALAAGWIPGIFRAMADQEPKDQALYEAAAQANTDAQPESMDIPQLEYSKFTLFERYYDGETILLGYDMSLMLPEPTVGYLPDAQTMQKIQEEILSYQTVASLQNLVFGDTYQKALDIMRETGYVCVVTHDVYVGDHIYVNGADIFEVLNEEVWSMREDYEVEEGSCIRLNPLPEAGRNQDSVTVTLKIKSSQQYWYFDTDGNCSMFKTDNHQEELMDFVLENVNQA